MDRPSSTSRPASVSSRPHWTVPVSREETLARREQFRKVGWRPPNYKRKTTKNIAWAKSTWDRYVTHDDLRYPSTIRARVTDSMLFRHCEHLGVDPDPYLLASGPADFETFIDWILRTTRKKTHGTVSQLWKQLCQSYSILAQQPMDSFTTGQVRRVRPVPFIHPQLTMPMLIYSFSTSTRRCTKTTTSVARHDKRTP